MDPITEHHYNNIRYNDIVRNDDGSTSTVRTIIMGDGEREYLIPTVWDGKVLSDEEAFQRAMESGVDWPSAPSNEDGIQTLRNIDETIHEGFSDQTTPQEAEDIILRGADYPNRSIVGTLLSPRPKPRPETNLSMEDLDKINRVVWGEARGETPEGRDAIRGVILNRLMSGRFGNTVDEVLTSSEFDAVNDFGTGTAQSIEVPQEDYDQHWQELVDYLQLGEDASQGRTFYQNEETATGRYEGVEPMKLGNHTFYSGLVGQEPVYDTNFSHNVKLNYEDQGFALGGLATARKGIQTEEGDEMANKKFQIDQNKADLDGDNKLSAYEQARGEAVQKAMADNPEQDEKYRMNCGGMMMPDDMIDPVSGNPIPIGSTADNVRDDIEIYVSEGEYVLPADVVKWHGLKHIMEMQDEAKMGLMGMYAEGLIQEFSPEAEEAEVEEEEEYETPEGNEVEMAEVEIEEEEPEVDETDDYAESDYGTSTTSLYGMVKKPKVTFIV